MSDLSDAREAWEYHLHRLAPEIMRDPVADALRKLANRVFGAYDAENAGLRAELDAAGRRSVLLCPASAMLDAMEASTDAEPGTVMRATDDPGLEYELGRDSQWRRK